MMYITNLELRSSDWVYAELRYKKTNKLVMTGHISHILKEIYRRNYSVENVSVFNGKQNKLVVGGSDV